MSLNITNSNRTYVPDSQYNNGNSRLSQEEIVFDRYIKNAQAALDGRIDGPNEVWMMKQQLAAGTSDAEKRVNRDFDNLWGRFDGNVDKHWKEMLSNSITKMQVENEGMAQQREAGLNPDGSNSNHGHGDWGNSGHGNQNNNWGSSNHNQNNNWGQSNHNQNNNWGSHGGNGHGNNNGNNNYGNNNNYGGHGGHGGRGNSYGCDDNGRQDYGQGHRKHHGQQYGFQSGFQSGYRSGYEDGYEDANSDNDSCRMHPHKAQSYGSSSHHSHLSDMFRAPGSMIPFLQAR